MNSAEKKFTAIADQLESCILSLVDQGHPPAAIVASLLGFTAQLIATSHPAAHAGIVLECCEQLASAVQRLRTRDQQGSNAQGLPS